MADPRVIFVNRVYWPSGSATAQLLADLAEALVARGWAVHVIAAGNDAGPRGGVTVHRTGTSETHGGLVSRALNHRAFLRAAGRQLAALARRGDVVVAMTDPPMLGARVAAVADARGARVVHWIQDIYPEIAAVHFGALAALLLKPLQARRDRAWRAAAACVTLGEDMARRVVARGVDPTRVQLAANWAPRELGEIPDPAAVAAQRRAWDCRERFVVAYSGNLGRVHEFATVLDAADRLRGDPAFLFLFIGGGPRFAEVAATARQRGLPNVRLLPPAPRANLPVALAAADAHLVTLRPEYGALVHPSKLAGALAAGRPVAFVGPVDGDIARLLRARDCGAAFAPGAAAALAARLREWRDDRAAVARLGANARAAYRAEFAADPAFAGWDARLRQIHGDPQVQLLR